MENIIFKLKYSRTLDISCKGKDTHPPTIPDYVNRTFLWLSKSPIINDQ